MNTQEPINKNTLNSLLFYCHNCKNFITIVKEMDAEQYKVKGITTFIFNCTLCNDSYCFYTVKHDGRIDISYMYGDRQEVRLEKADLCFFCNKLCLNSDMIEIPLVGNVCNACYLRSKQNEAPM